MIRPIDNCYLQHSEEINAIFQSLRAYILNLDKNMNETMKYGMPFFCYKKKMCCYLWVDKKLKQPYIGIVEGKSIHHPDLIQGTRIRMKILLLDSDEDLPMDTIDDIFQQMIVFYEGN